MKLIGGTKIKKNKDKNGENMPHLETTEVALKHYNIDSGNYQQDSRVLDTFVPKKSFSQLLDISPKHFMIWKTLDSEFSGIEVWFIY